MVVVVDNGIKQLQIPKMHIPPRNPDLTQSALQTIEQKIRGDDAATGYGGLGGGGPGGHG